MNQRYTPTDRPSLTLDSSSDSPIQTQYLFNTDFYQFKHWDFDLDEPGVSHKGYNDCFCLVFVNQGRFVAQLATQAYDLHTGHVLVEKANYEYQLRPASGACSILNFSADFYQQLQEEYRLRHSFFFSNPNVLTLGLKTTPTIDYLHYHLRERGRGMARLERDQLVLDLVRHIVERLENNSLTAPLSTGYKQFHLTTIEQAKAYLNGEFNRDLSLLDLASHCCVSPFHLGRLFKACTGYAPHHYLLRIRLTHAERLLRDTSLPITEVSYASGFNSVEHFATSFRQWSQVSPSQYRKQAGQCFGKEQLTNPL
ncbi:helix-turn-helix transcriptional regulator [Spirosoma sp. BT702]|uniref:Helix-turn-helix transcriptional regulator n=1 Tax=Spirosoma profusum TaxID=2771354 RepID=A0A927AUU8_9BACT|nr:AraC family transcriptional regulator [Spirosoma profusum]MBD2704840.1 helix-turn-helix transcriptional regulator [Spirosoma profusum]